MDLVQAIYQKEIMMANIPPDHQRISASRILAMKTTSLVVFLSLARGIWIVTVVVVALAFSARATD